LDLTAGTHVDRYVVHDVLGSGGMATVYRVRHASLGTWHALKVLKMPTQAVRDRLLSEGRAQGSLSHPNVVNVTDLIEVDGSPGLVMELIPGVSLADHLRMHALSLPQADSLARGILEGVLAAHAAGLVHRDLKPANILLLPTQGTVVPKVTDFGLVKLVDVATGSSQTRTGSAMGTPSYMAPEQVRDASSVDARADVFSLGAVLYELVTGRRSFVGDDMLEVFQAVVDGRFADLERLAPQLPERMRAAIEGALISDRETRIQTVGALLELWCGDAPHPDAVDGGPWDDPSLEKLHLSGPTAAPSQADAGATFETPGQTWSGPASAGPTPVEHRPRRWPWAVAAAALVLGVLGGMFVLRTPDDALTVVSEDPAIQDHYRRGWDALAAVDLPGARAHFQTAVDAEPGPMTWLMLGETQYRQGTWGPAHDAYEHALELFGDDKGRDATFAQLLVASRFRRPTREGWQALFHDEPDDYAWHLLEHGFLFDSWPEEELVTLIDQVITRNPVPLAPLLSKATLQARLGLFEDAGASLRAARAHSPSSAVVWEVTGEWHMEQRSWSDAAEAFTQTLSHDAGALTARLGLAEALDLLGELEERERQLEMIFSPTHAATDRATIAGTMVVFELSRGRRSAARAQLERCLDVVAEEGVWSQAGTCLPLAMWSHVEQQDVAELKHDLALASKLASVPEVPQTVVTAVSMRALHAQGMLAAWMGDGASAARILKRLENLGPEHQGPMLQGRIELLAGALADVQGDHAPGIAAARAQHARQKSCVSAWFLGRALAAAGERAEARSLLSAATDGSLSCSGWDAGRTAEAFAWVELGALSLAEGGTAEEALSALAGLWPHADADHPALARLRSVEGAVREPAPNSAIPEDP
jgi:tetratricopeptide (TPR) repeat protein